MGPEPGLRWALAIGAMLIALAVVSPVLAAVAVLYHAALVVVATRDLARLPGRSGFAVRRVKPEPFSLGEREEVSVVIENPSAAALLARIADHAPSGLLPEPPAVPALFDRNCPLRLT